MTVVTLELLLPDSCSTTVRDALEAIAGKLSDVGYSDAEYAFVKSPDEGTVFHYRVIQGFPTDR
jgi:hypothetical protein